MYRFQHVLCACALICAPGVAAKSYITDKLTIPLRSGASNQHRIIHAGLPSGTALDILQTDEASGFSQIRTQRGTEGWVRTQYLVDEPPAMLKLSAAQAEATRLKNRLGEATKRIEALTNTRNEISSTSQQQSDRIASLEKELADLKAISDNAVNTHEENLRLAEVNQRLQRELDKIANENVVLSDNATNEGIMLGAGFILLGLIAGVLIKARPQRSAWS